MREYELTYIVRPDIEEEALAAVTVRVEQTIATNGGRVIKVEPWGKRRMAYTIRRHNEGYYTLVRAELTDKAIREVERQMKLSEDILRHLLVHVEPTPEVTPTATEQA